MREFLKGWRRKAGCVTLMAALMLFGMWMRSYLTLDSVVAGGQASVHIFASFDGGMSWSRYPAKPAQQGFRWQSVRRTDYHFDGWWQGAIDREIVWRLRCGGFNCGAAIRNFPLARERADFCMVPYWSLVLSLTLLSAYLLLGKPPSAKTPATQPGQSAAL